MTAVLAVEHLSVALPAGGDRGLAVEDVSLEVMPGEILCVVGESGSGKSVLASAVMGALPRGLRRAGGRVVFRGEDISDLPEARLRSLRGRDISMVFQEPMAALNPAMRIGAQVAEVFAIHAPEVSERVRNEKVFGLLTEMQLPNPAAIAQRYPHELSGGQCQRVVIAMAMALNPALLVADEPTTALDVTTQAQILALVRRLRAPVAEGGHGQAVLFITHDIGVVSELADRVAVMQQGKLVEIGPVGEVLRRPGHAYTRMLLEAVPPIAPAPRAAPAEEIALRIEGLSKSFGIVRAVDDVTLTLPRGGTVAIVGESGSGKSTLARAVIRLVQPDSGRVLVEGSDFAVLKPKELLQQRRAIQMVFQDPHGALNPRRSVSDMLVRAGVLGGLDVAEARLRARELVALVGLPEAALQRRPTAFSGGQRQRIGIARALAMRPTIVIADESVSALDVSVQKQVLDLLEEVQARTGMSLLFITHDLRVAARVADRIVVMRRGQVVEEGTAEQVLTAPAHPYTIELVAAAPGRDWALAEAQ